MLADLSQRVRSSLAHFGIGIIEEHEQLGHCPRRAKGGHYEHINASLSDSGMLTVEGGAQIWDDTVAQAGQRAGGAVCRIAQVLRRLSATSNQKGDQPRSRSHCVLSHYLESLLSPLPFH